MLENQKHRRECEDIIEVATSGLEEQRVEPGILKFRLSGSTDQRPKVASGTRRRDTEFLGARSWKWGCGWIVWYH